MRSGLLTAYAAALLAYLLLRAFTGDRLWPVALLHWAAVPAAFVALVLMPPALIWRRWPTAALLCLCAAWLLVLLGAGSILRQPSRPAEGGFVVMTYNLHLGHIPPDRLTAYLRASGADIVGLQELNTMQAEAITHDLADSYPYQALYGGGIEGTGLLSRYPLRDVQRLELYPQRPDLRALVDLDGRSLTVIVGHPLPPRLHRDGYYFNPATEEQLAALRDLTAASDPALLLADLNLTPLHQSYTDLRHAGLVDSFAEAGRGLGLTLPRREVGITTIPIVRIDYIWHTSGLIASDCWVGGDGGSDHLPVLARLRWR